MRFERTSHRLFFLYLNKSFEITGDSRIDKAINKRTTERCLPIRKHRGAREKRYSFGYAVFLILALMK